MNPRTWGWFDGFKSVAFWGWTDAAVILGGPAPVTIERVVTSKAALAGIPSRAVMGASFPLASQAGSRAGAVTGRAVVKAALSALTAKADPWSEPAKGGRHSRTWVSVKGRFTPSVTTADKPGLRAGINGAGKAVKK